MSKNKSWIYKYMGISFNDIIKEKNLITDKDKHSGDKDSSKNYQNNSIAELLTQLSSNKSETLIIKASTFFLVSTICTPDSFYDSLGRYIYFQ